MKKYYKKSNMSDQKDIKIVVDTNLWISFCIGTRLHSFIDAIIKKRVILCFSAELYDEIFDVLNRPKIKAKIDREKVKELHNILAHRSIITNTPFYSSECRDPKDNFLLDLAVSAEADYLITGDNDLLVLNPYQNVNIINASEFEIILKNIK